MRDRRRLLQALGVSSALLLPGAFFPVSASAGEIQRVSASKGPIELSLEVASRTIPVGGAPWVALELRNVGKEMIIVLDKVFSEHAWDIAKAHQRERGPGVLLEAKGPSGKMFRFGYQRVPHECLMRKMNGERLPALENAEPAGEV